MGGTLEKRQSSELNVRFEKRRERGRLKKVDKKKGGGGGRQGYPVAGAIRGKRGPLPGARRAVYKAVPAVNSKKKGGKKRGGQRKSIVWGKGGGKRGGVGRRRETGVKYKRGERGKRTFDTAAEGEVRRTPKGKGDGSSSPSFFKRGEPCRIERGEGRTQVKPTKKKEGNGFATPPTKKKGGRDELAGD